MKKILKETVEELKQFMSGKTIDTIIPPIIYVIGNNLFGLNVGIILALSVAFLFALLRLLKKENILYALGGIGGVALASGFALIADNAANYFLPKIIGSGALFLISTISIFVGKPLAAILSHVSRGWSFDWFLRKDIKPAYREVTIVWAILFLARMLLQLFLYNRGNLTELGWASILLGFPATLTVLVLTLIYGGWRLRVLGGPGIEEFQEGKNPPWEGQKKGF
ncbi:Protein of unknown function [Carnobacterium iners]|uniref:Intracellular septation protein A n=1 Tax=Carnobacterium iners TaxID=1073423 RepID=A0A1X7MS79_9LACT|nr:DUF3159 domain-containing protein [Carnobacterium iners]SEK73501.1 Protein of unknown function [Carnobacterium iners]SMH27474.1 Protein of unknown function [Carnobacterium iners]